MPPAPDAQDIIDAIDSEDARRVLALASLEPMSVEEFEGELGASTTTLYRHTEELNELEFLTEETEITPDGDHYSTYETTVRSIEFTIADGEFRVDLGFRDDIVDRFSRVWRSLGEPSS